MVASSLQSKDDWLASCDNETVETTRWVQTRGYNNKSCHGSSIKARRLDFQLCCRDIMA